ncbi:MAG: SPOR domain-containing protein [Sideroxydans sp.]|jgi:cell division protein FtsN
MANGGTTQKKSKTIASMIVGIMIGVTIAGIVAWYMTQKNPASFKEPPVAREMVQPLPPPVANAPVPHAATAPDQAQKFEFYRALPDKSDGAPTRRSSPTVKQSVKPAAIPADTAPYIVQAGSFQNPADAEKLKARLALAGFEATVQSVDLPGKGIWHRVRLGPYRDMNAANEAITGLKANGVVNATASHTQ